MVGNLRKQLEIGSKRRICPPPEMREQIGDTAMLKKIDEGFLLMPGQPRSFLKEFCKVIASKSELFNVCSTISF
jgi:hypothetical protein